MLIFALVLAVIGLAALVTAVVTSNELIAWVCIGASVIGVLLLIVDAVRERSRGDDSAQEADHEPSTTVIETAEDYPDEPETEVHQVIEPDTVAVSTDQTDDGDTEDTKRV